MSLYKHKNVSLTHRTLLLPEECNTSELGLDLGNSSSNFTFQGIGSSFYLTFPTIQRVSLLTPWPTSSACFPAPRPKAGLPRNRKKSCKQSLFWPRHIPGACIFVYHSPEMAVESTLDLSFREPSPSLATHQTPEPSCHKDDSVAFVGKTKRSTLCKLMAGAEPCIFNHWSPTALRGVLLYTMTPLLTPQCIWYTYRCVPGHDIVTDRASMLFKKSTRKQTIPSESFAECTETESPIEAQNGSCLRFVL